VEVYNALGALVGSFQLNGNSELEGLHTTGMYTVKVTDRNGNVDFVKLVVK
ncbi:MAG: T9SS type A sorting domain-containing protein, partial [Bacteroidales bacterium]|nr:T9SS type A sorting domain-containing protein [Bacteroidales bacterium]